MDFRQIEFLAENELIDVQCLFTYNPDDATRLPKVMLFCGNYGPFRAGERVTVPLWLAIFLKTSRRCTIFPPEWMNPDTLEELKSAESSSRTFTAMPSAYYMNIAHLLFAHAPDDIAHGDQIKTLIKDIWDHRQAKLRTSMEQLMKAEVSMAKVDHITPLEICLIRGFLTGSLDHLQRLETALEQTFNLGTFAHSAQHPHIGSAPGSGPSGIGSHPRGIGSESQ